MKTDVDKNRCFWNLLYRVPFGKLGLLLAFLIVASHLWGQGITVKGRVTDTDDAPVIGASVLVEGTESGMITDLDGNYVINNVPSDAVLVFSYVGMVTQKVAVSGRHVVNVKLEDDNVLLDETVVIGGRANLSSKYKMKLQLTDGKIITTIPTMSILFLRKACGGGSFIRQGHSGGAITIRKCGCFMLSRMRRLSIRLMTANGTNVYRHHFFMQIFSLTFPNMCSGKHGQLPKEPVPAEGLSLPTSRVLVMPTG